MVNHFGSIVNTKVVHYDGIMTNEAQMKIRMTEALRDSISNAAKENNRSMNAEIIARLEKSFDAEESLEDQQKRRAELRALAVEEIEQFMNSKGLELIETAFKRANRKPGK